MDTELVVGLLRNTIWTTLLTSSPLLFTALATGLIISIFQAATQINEQTLTFVPKILFTLGIFGATFPFFVTTLVEFTRQMIQGSSAVGP